jgi:hypothetical protein
MLDAPRLVPRPLRRRYADARSWADRALVRRGILALAVLMAAAVYVYYLRNVYEGDAYGYWQSIRWEHLYQNATASGAAPQGYLYSPAFDQALWPLLSLPWLLFHAVWLGLLTALLAWMARPWLACLLFATFLVPGIDLLAVPRHYLSSGNIFLPMALAVVAGFRWPWTYSFLLLTKVTPGIGLLWFLVRREWRNLFIALAATAAVVAVSFAFSSNLWFDWVNVLKSNAGYSEPGFALHLLPLLPRLVIASLMTVVAARYDARWVVPIAAMIALPYITDTALIMIVGVVPLLRHDAWTEGRTGRTAGSRAAGSRADTARSDTAHADSAPQTAQPLPAA